MTDDAAEVLSSFNTGIITQLEKIKDITRQMVSLKLTEVSDMQNGLLDLVKLINDFFIAKKGNKIVREFINTHSRSLTELRDSVKSLSNTHPISRNEKIFSNNFREYLVINGIYFKIQGLVLMIKFEPKTWPNNPGIKELSFAFIEKDKSLRKNELGMKIYVNT